MSNIKKNLGHVTAYAYYKAGGGTMTEEEFTEYMADFGDAAERAVDAASEAAQSKADAQTAAATATDKADEAAASASSASGSAASAAEDASTASTAANTATGAATTATSAKNDAVSAKTAAQSAKTAAETAASTATTKAGEAATSATNAAASAQSVASSAAQITQNAEDIDALKEDLTPLICTTDYTSQMIANKVFLTNNETVIDVTDDSYVQDMNNWCYAIIECMTGDCFEIVSSSASGAKGYIFLDADGNVLEKAYSSDQSSVVKYNRYAPAKSAYLIVNARTNKDHSVRKGLNANQKIDDSHSAILATQKYVGGYLIDSWQEGYAYYITSQNMKLFRPNVDVNCRTCIIEVSEGDVFYYSGSNYIDANDTASSARPYGLFDSDGVLVSFADSGIYNNHKITVPSGIKYVVLNQSNYYGYKDCYFGGIPSDNGNEVEDYTAINRTLKIVNDYTDESLHYNTTYSPWYYNDSYGDERGLTCSDWAMLSCFGIDSKYSKWGGMPNLVAYGFDGLNGLFELKSNSDGAWSEQIAKYIDDNYLSYTPSNDMSNVKSGDILFYDLSPDNDNDPMYYPPTEETLTRYKGVDHCAVVADVVSEDYYSVFEVAGSPQNDHGYVTLKYLAIGSRTIVTALRPKSYVKYGAKKYASFTPTKITKVNYHDISISEPIPKDKWVTVSVKAERYKDSYIGIRVKYVGSDSFTSIISEGSFGSGVHPKDVTAFLFKASSPIDTIRVISYAVPSGQNVQGFHVYEVNVYDGFDK